MSTFSLLFALLFVGGQKLINSQDTPATQVFHNDDSMVIDNYEKEEVHLDAKSQGDLEELGFGDRTSKDKVSPSQFDIILYEHENYSGKNKNVYFAGSSTCYNLPADFNLRISSVKTALNSSNVYMLCSQKNCQGIKKEVKQDMPFIGWINDKVQSVAQLPFLQAAILYEHKNYGGKQFNITFPQNSDCQNLPKSFINITSSVMASIPIILRTEKNCKGEKMRIKTNVPRLNELHDQVQSVQKEMPAAILYEGYNYEGKKAYITFPECPCETLPKYLQKSASSMIAFEYVKLRTDFGCNGGIYQNIGTIPRLPAINGSWRIDDKVVTVQKVLN